MIKIKVISLVILLGIILLLSNTNDTQLEYSQAQEIDKIESVHTCIDSNHISCDGHCICDGLGCN